MVVGYTDLRVVQGRNGLIDGSCRGGLGNCREGRKLGEVKLDVLGKHVRGFFNDRKSDLGVGIDRRTDQESSDFKPDLVSDRKSVFKIVDQNVRPFGSARSSCGQRRMGPIEVSVKIAFYISIVGSRRG